MERLKVKKLSKKGRLPERAKQGDLGYDLFSCEKMVIPPGGMRPLRTGIAVEFPEGWGGIIKDRSSMAMKRITTSAGVIDSGYRGEIVVLMSNDSDKDFVIEPDDKIAQLVPMEVCSWEVVEVDKINETHRGKDGFGSTGKRKEGKGGEKMAKDANLEYEREARTYELLGHGASWLIEKTEENEKGSTYTNMASLLLSAFSFEAYLNHLGEAEVKFWDEIERIPVLKKYSVLCKIFKIKPDNSRRPNHTLTGLFKFRNYMAHGKTEKLNITKVISSQDNLFNHRPKTDWEEYCTLENAKKAKEDVAKIITELHKKAGSEGHPFIGPPSFYSKTPKNPSK